MTKSKYLQHSLIFSQRVELEELLSSGIPKTEIAKILEVSKSTVYREMKRCDGLYNAEDAQIHVDERKEQKAMNNSRHRNEIKFRLDQLEAKIQKLENLLKGKNE